MPKRWVGRAIKKLDHQLDRCGRIAGAPSADDPVTMMQGWVIHYLVKQGDRPVCQGELEAGLGVRRSTVSQRLDLMEKRGLITRQVDAQDQRKKQVLPTAKALEMHACVTAQLDRMEQALLAGFTETELEQLHDMLDRLRHNVQAYEEQLMGGERP